MAIFIDSSIAKAVANIIITEPCVIYLCHVVPNFEAEWNKHTAVATLGHYLHKYYGKQSGDFKAAYPDTDLTRNVRAHLVLFMNPLYHLREGEFGRALDETIQDFFREWAA